MVQPDDELWEAFVETKRPRWTRAHAASPNPIKNSAIPTPWRTGLLTMVTFKDSEPNDQIHDDKCGKPQADELPIRD